MPLSESNCSISLVLVISFSGCASSCVVAGGIPSVVVGVGGAAGCGMAVMVTMGLSNDKERQVNFVCG